MRSKTFIGDLEIGERPLVCASVFEGTEEKAKESIKKAFEAKADLIELRLDALCSSNIKPLISSAKIPVIATNRSSYEGGLAENEDDRIESILDAIIHGTNAVDIELSTEKERRDEVIKEAHSNEISVIISSHNFHETPSKDEIIGILRKERESGADISKVATFAQNKKDLVTVLDATNEAKYLDYPSITIAMGESGELSRLICPLLGSCITYAHVGKKSAPGQLSIEKLKKFLELMND